MNAIFLFFICTTWVILMGCIIDRLYNAHYNETRKQFRFRLFMSCCIIITITCIYAWAITSIASFQEEQHMQLMLTPASDQCISSTSPFEHTLVAL